MSLLQRLVSLKPAQFWRNQDQYYAFYAANSFDLNGPIMLISLFLVCYFNFLFIPCGRLSWLPVSFLLHVKYTLSYRIVS